MVMMDKRKEHLVIVRTSGSILDLKTYNCQELGLARALSRKGWKVSLILAGRESSSFKFGDVSVFCCKLYAMNQQLAYFEGISDLLKRLSPTIIQIHEIGLLMSWVVACWSKKNDVPCVLIQGNYRTTQKPILKQFECLFNWTFGKSILKKIKAVGYKTQMAQCYVRKFSCIKSFPTYIGLDESKLQSEQIRDWKKELNIENKHVLLYVGNFESRRNPIFLLKVLQNLPSSVCLLMAGDGNQFMETTEYVKKWDLSDRCFLLGKLRQDELASLYKNADLFLLASNYEIYGMVILEAMYFGVPVISTLTAGSESIIENGKNGIIIKELDEIIWGRQIQEILQSPELLTKMKKSAIEKINNKLLWDKAVDRFVDLYNYKKTK